MQGGKDQGVSWENASFASNSPGKVTHPLNAPSQHILSTHPLNTPSQHILSTHQLQHTLSARTLQLSLSTHPITPLMMPLRAHPLNPPSQSTLSIHPLNNPFSTIPSLPLASLPLQSPVGNDNSPNLNSYHNSPVQSTLFPSSVPVQTQLFPGASDGW